MDEELWGVYYRLRGLQVTLRKTDPDQYEMIIEWEIGGEVLAVDLDRKHIKDLFNVLGKELGVF